MSQKLENIQQRERIYITFNYPEAVPGSKTLLTGIRGISKRRSQDILYITGFYETPSSETISFLYRGDLTGRIGVCSENSWNILNYPSTPGMTVQSTNLYGPLILDRTNIRAVGSYTTVEAGNRTFGCMYEGPLDGSGIWITLTPTPTEETINTIAHSTMGDLIVGNYDTGNFINKITGKAFIYNVKTKKYYNIEKMGAKSITAYGIWYNGNDDYTICGGFSNLDPVSGIDAGYLVDWNNEIHEFCNWKLYYYNNDNKKSVVTHFDGITSDGNGGYNLTGDAILINKEQIAFFTNIKRNHGCYFGEAKWEMIEFPDSDGTSGNSVYEKMVIGVYKKCESEETTISGYISLMV